jgi:hypothetical protein
MDEYLFITMAKLQADRLRLERQQRAERLVKEAHKEPADDRKRSARTGWFTRQPQWREQS